MTREMKKSSSEKIFMLKPWGLIAVNYSKKEMVAHFIFILSTQQYLLSIYYRSGAVLNLNIDFGAVSKATKFASL